MSWRKVIPTVALITSLWVAPGTSLSDEFSGTPADSAAARACFEKFKALQGDWVGRSTRGWVETVSYRVIAAGSVVMATSFEAHPNETMVTLFALDGSKLGLTHYCVAGNQPRLVASRILPDGQEVLFTYRDGGNLPTRDRGHMDRVVYRFLDGNRVSSQWTWFQDGKEQWMEEILLERKQ